MRRTDPRPTCGFVASCGRLALHRGQHGGWRTGIAVIAPDPIQRTSDVPGVDLGVQFTPRELQVLGEVIIHGSQVEASKCLGIKDQTLKNHCWNMMCKTGARSTMHVAWLLGWITLPQGIHHD